MILPQMFLSYSTLDAKFIDRLESDVRKAGVECWRDKGRIRTGDRLDEAIFNVGIPQCNLFVAYITNNYLESKNWCMREIERAIDSRVIVIPLADSETSRESFQKIDDRIRCDVVDDDRYSDVILKLVGRAWESLQSAQRLVSSEDHIFAARGMLDSGDYSREQLVKRAKRELVLAGPNLRSWLSNPATKQSLVDAVKDTNINVKLIMATYETLRPVAKEGAEHLRQSAEDVKEMLEALTPLERKRMEAFFHPGATTLSAVFIDPESLSGLLFFTPRWAIQFQPPDRLTCVIDKSINSAWLYNAIYNSIFLMTQRDARTVDEMLIPEGGA